MVKSQIFATAIATVVADRPLDWVATGCPRATASEQCSYRNPSRDKDMAVVVFFQVEDTQGAASFQCGSGKVVHCERSWAFAEQGSAGTCFFILGADEEFQCSGTGQVNTIEANGIQLTDKIMDATTSDIPCSGSLSDCSYSNTDVADQWVSMSFATSSVEETGLQCTVDEKEVCRFNVKGDGDASSCGFLVPAGSSLHCKATAGSPTVQSAIARKLSRNIAPLGSPAEATCPPESVDPSLCDCSYDGTDSDAIVSISAANGDDVFNSFHCYVWGSNVCAWGANNGENGAAGNCYFILPAGSTYECEMEWGATAFPSVTITPLAGGSLFPSSTSNANKPSNRATRAPQLRSENELRRLFEEFTAKHGPQDPARFHNFKNYVAMVDHHPTNSPLTAGGDLSLLAMLSRDEFESTHRNCAHAGDLGLPKALLSAEDSKNTPSKIDWRDHGAVTPVKDQGQCGSCWAFSSTGVLEGAWAVAGHGLTSLSEQQLVSCDNQDDNEGCDGGWPYLAIEYVHANGIDTEESYPYASAGGSAPGCQASSGIRADISVVKHVQVESDEDAMAAWVAKNGPVSVSVDAMTQLWWSYTGGIMTGCCNTDVDHAVLIVGFGEENGQKYWLIKNSWSDTWGEGGLLRLERGTNQCGITYQPVGVVVSGAPTPTPPTPTPPTPTPPTPTPPTPTPTPPTPTPGACPDDAKLEKNECLWVNGTLGLVMPPNPREYCDYIDQGYFGYTWDLSAGDYECVPSARKSANSDTGFCVWEDGSRGMVVPPGAQADCGDLSAGRIGIILPTSQTFLV